MFENVLALFDRSCWCPVSRSNTESSDFSRKIEDGTTPLAIADARGTTASSTDNGELYDLLPVAMTSAIDNSELVAATASATDSAEPVPKADLLSSNKSLVHRREYTDDERHAAARKIQRLFLGGTARRRRLRRHLLFAAKLSKKKASRSSAKLGKQKVMSGKYWIEAADPQHRYGHLLDPYYRCWMESNTNCPFFEWLDKGAGAELDLEESPRQQLMESHVDYLDKDRREQCEVDFKKDDDGQVRLCYKHNGKRVNTPTKCCFCLYLFGGPTKYIFVVDAHKNLYTHVKKKGHFHHSSFLSGKPVIAAGGLVVKDGKLLVVNGNSGHYKPTAKMLEKTFHHYEKHFGLERNSYTIVYPITGAVKLCGLSCCPAIADNSPCFGSRERAI